METDLIVDKSDLSNARLVSSPLVESHPGPGQVKLQVDRFGLTSNNLSYAGAGEIMGYWNYFPSTDPAWGIVPAWGFATVVESQHDQIQEGEELFGYLPMCRYLMVEPHAVGAAHFSDRFAHRAELHPWYNRYYRVAGDPSSAVHNRDLQPLLWALHMTGWMLARRLDAAPSFDQLIVASASSKTAVALARSMQVLDNRSLRVGLTSQTNRPFVESLGCYDEVRTYDEMQLDDLDRTAVLVDMSGNAAVVSEVHHAFGDRLVESIRVGGTHRSARGDTDGLPGPDRDFFFIPNAAEERSATIGQDAYHREFAAAWVDYCTWVDEWVSVAEATGPEAIQSAYERALAGAHDPATGLMLRY